MSHPPVLPEWATDEKYTSGDDIGLDTRLAPTAGEIAQGFHRGKRPPARKVNWLLGTICDWIKHLSEDRPYTFLVTSNGTVDIPTLYPWAKRMRVRLCGGGGGGGAGNSVPGQVPGAGGGSGYLAEAEVTPQELTFALGAGGTGSSDATALGGNGGTSTCSGSAGLRLVAAGGKGGLPGNSSGHGGDGFNGGGGRGGGGSPGGDGGEGGSAGGDGSTSGGLGIAFVVGAGSSMPGGKGGGPGSGGGGGGGGHFEDVELAEDGDDNQATDSAGEGGVGWGAGGGGGVHAGDNGGDGAPGAAEVTVW